MTTPATRLAAVLAAAVTASVLLSAATPTFWIVSTQAEFLRGEVNNLSIDTNGHVTLGPLMAQVAETTAPAVWTLLQDASGYYAGTGNDGLVLRITPNGTVTTLFDAPELQVHALAPAPGGGIYAATSPDGKVYRVQPDGSATPFFDPDDKYIWSLALDPKGAVYVGTGDRGRIYRVTPDGQGEIFYDTQAANVVALAFDGNNRLLAGTEKPGRLFRIDASGKGFVLIESTLPEIHALFLTPAGVIYAAAVGAAADAPGTPRPPAETGASVPVPTVSTEITSIAIVDTGAAVRSAQPPRPEPRAAPKGLVYRIQPDGLWDVVWESPEDLPYDLVHEPSGSLLIATGGHGKIFRVTGEPPRVTLVARAAAEQVTTLIRQPDGPVVLATANPARLFRMSPETARRGTYLSDVRDAKTVATWGSIRWRASGGGRVEISTRSGNTSTPDVTWSDWSPPYQKPDGDAIASPKARYLQWRAVLLGPEASSPGPVLTSVTAAFLSRNLKPTVASITVHPPGTVFQRPFPTSDVVELAGFDSTPVDGRPGIGSPGAGASATIGRRLYQKGLQTFGWSASDDNDDTLRYDVSYRREDETEWRLLKRGLWEPILVWDTTSVPDGRYTVRVSASDGPSNPPDTALVGEAESAPFDIDNTPPRIEITGTRTDGGRTVLTFIVRDAQSPVRRVEYSVDAERWRAIHAADGLADSLDERYEVVLEGSDGSGSVIIRATDALDNVATAAGGRTR